MLAFIHAVNKSYILILFALVVFDWFGDPRSAAGHILVSEVGSEEAGRGRCGRRFSGSTESCIKVVRRGGGCDHKHGEGASE